MVAFGLALAICDTPSVPAVLKRRLGATRGAGKSMAALAIS